MENILRRIYLKLFRNSKLLYNVILPGRDLLSCVREPKLFGLHRRLGKAMAEQRRKWENSYTGSYYYQGLRRIGIAGVKPTEDRIENYEILPLLNKEQRLLDVGSNAGFMCLYLANYVGSVEGVELNPYLNDVAREVQSYLQLDNANFVTTDFSEYSPEGQFDIVLSLSNHHTIDGNLDMGFENYIRKIFDLLVPGGYLFFESHNILGDDKTGDPGDDSDLDEKFDIAERYFEVLRHRMVPCYRFTDIDKLFVVMKRRPEYAPDAVRTLSLAEAREKYHF